MERSGLANPRPVSPHPGVTDKSADAPGPAFQERATSPPSGTSELPSHEKESPAVAVVPAAPKAPETGGRNRHTAPSQQQPVPVLQFPVPQPIPERSTTLGPRVERDLPPRPSPPRITTARPMSIGNFGSSSEKLEEVDTLSGIDFPELHRDSALRTDQPLHFPSRARMVDNGATPTRRQRDIHYGRGSMAGHGPDPRRQDTSWIAAFDQKVSYI
jgi:hypothetical protein